MIKEVVIIIKIKDRNPLLKLLIVLVILQLMRMIIEQILFLFVDKTSLNCDITAMLTLCLLIAVIVFVSHKQNITLSVMPNKLSTRGIIGYIFITIFLVFLIVSAPFFSGNFSADIIIPLIYSTIATPIFEELIFRGYIWKELEKNSKTQFKVYIISTIFFAIWHLGYIDIIWFKLSLTGEVTGILFIMLMKVITGLCFGIIIGLVRYKAKNCYAAILMHSLMNVFGR